MLVFQSVLILGGSFSAIVYAQKLQIPPPIPKSYPPADETKFITGAYLQDPLVVDAWNYVQSVVPASILAYPPSTYILYSNVKYHADPVATCYWPYNLCTTSSLPNIPPDVVSCPGANDWGLSYDDGPTQDNPGTPELRKALKDANVKATHFIVGTNAAFYPDQMTRLYNEGHELGVHTWTHHPLTSLSNLQIIAEIKYTEAIIYQAIGKVPKLFRPPYGDIDDRVRSILVALGYQIVLWSQDSTDADVTPNAKEHDIVTSIISKWFSPQPGFISLEHNIDAFTTNIDIQTLQKIQAAKAAGTLGTNPKPVGECTGIQWYRNIGYGDGASNGSVSTTTTAKSQYYADTTVSTGYGATSSPTGKNQAKADDKVSGAMRASGTIIAVILAIILGGAMFFH